MIWAPAWRRSSGLADLTEPWVPTGMKMGVATGAVGGHEGSGAGLPVRGVQAEVARAQGHGRLGTAEAQFVARLPECGPWAISFALTRRREGRISCLCARVPWMGGFGVMLAPRQTGESVSPVPAGCGFGKTPARRPYPGVRHAVERTAQGIRTQRRGSPLARALGGRERLHPGPGRARRTLLHRHSAPQCDGLPAHGPRPEHHPAGHPVPLPPAEGPPGALDPRHGPRRHRHPERGGAAAGRGGQDPP